MTRDRVTIALPGPDRPSRTAVIDRARRRGFSRFLDVSAPPLTPAEGEEVVRSDAGRLRGAGPAGSDVTFVRVADASELERQLAGVPDGGVLAIEWVGDRVIPLENTLAARAHRFAVWVYARSPSEVPGALGALEHGADRVFVEVTSPEDVDLLEAYVEGPTPTHLDWVTAPVTSTRPAGVGDRVLVDTTSLLRADEGLLVGSAAGFLFLVVSEAVGSKFSRARPFRVNAGAAHSYVLLADGSTRYLSELEPGDAVLVTRSTGPARTARVGRIKIERRPLVMVTSRDAERDRTVFLQEAETVRLSTDAGRVSTTELAPGARVHGVRLPPARHLGRPIDETIEER